MVAGEFAVLEPYHHLIVMAVNRFLYASVHKSDENLITLENFALRLQWSITDGKVRLSIEDERTSFVQNALEVVLAYLAEHSIEICSFHLMVRSELDDQSGIKYGLGSSAAVVTAVVESVLRMFWREDPDQQLIFKLAAIAHVMTQRGGSGADIAASTYGGVLQYTSFQAEWLLRKLENSHDIQSVVHAPWPYLSIRSIKFPESLHLRIGWTGSPASTTNLVREIRSLKTKDPVSYQKFLEKSEEAVRRILEGIERTNEEIFLQGIQMNRLCLKEVGEKANVSLETAPLKVLSDLAEDLNGAGKLSGAGGGDCGIAFMPSLLAAERLEKAWKKENIQPLRLAIYDKE